MNQLNQIATRIMDSIKTNSSSKDEETKYDCNLCKDDEWIFDSKTNTAKECSCRETKLYKRILESSGVSEAFLRKTLDNFIPKDNTTTNAKNMAIDYVRNFEQIKNTNNNSIAFLGQVGAGKTHLSIAIANELMNKGIGVRYMQYREGITRIKQVANDELSYAQEINKYKNATVLIIDDLYKSATYKSRTTGMEFLNDADERAMFEIINHRYFKQAPMIISSELGMGRLLGLDEGLNSRILDMCQGHMFEFEGKQLNHRLYK